MLLCCCVLQLLPLLTKAWHYLVSAMHAYLAAMLMRFSLRMTQALSDSGRDGYDAISSYRLARTKHSVPAYVPVGEYLRMKAGRALVTRIRGQP